MKLWLIEASRVIGRIFNYLEMFLNFFRVDFSGLKILFFMNGKCLIIDTYDTDTTYYVMKIHIFPISITIHIIRDHHTILSFLHPLFHSSNNFARQLLPTLSTQLLRGNQTKPSASFLLETITTKYDLTFF